MVDGNDYPKGTRVPISHLDLDTGLRAESDLSRIAGRLQDVAASRFDVVAGQSALRCKAPHRLMVELGTPQITDQGVTESVIVARYTRTAWRQMAERLHIPLQYLDRLMAMEHTMGPMLGCQSINDLAFMDDRRALYRFVNTTDGYVLRAILSNRYQGFDNDTAITAILNGFTDAGIEFGNCEVTGDVTPDRLRLRIAVPQVQVAVPDLLGDYRMPYSLRPGNAIHAAPDRGETPPVLWAGIEVANSETGNGAFTIAPRVVIQVCRNGLTRAVDFRRAHIGASLEEGSIDWSAETQRQALALITSQVRDAVVTYISPSYLQNTVEEMRAAKQVGVENAVPAVDAVQRNFGLTEVERDAVFELFAAGGDRTVLGLGQAVTAAAQLADDGDRQSELESTFWAIVGQPMAYAGA